MLYHTPIFINDRVLRSRQSFSSTKAAPSRTRLRNQELLHEHRPFLRSVQCRQSEAVCPGYGFVCRRFDVICARVVGMEDSTDAGVLVPTGYIWRRASVDAEPVELVCCLELEYNKGYGIQTVMRLSESVMSQSIWCVKGVMMSYLIDLICDSPCILHHKLLLCLSKTPNIKYQHPDLRSR